MKETTPNALTEADILDHVISPHRPGLPPEFARNILDLRFDQTALKRMNDLAEKNRADTLSASERAEMEKYMRVGQFLNLLQAKARVSLHEPSAPL
ncbi:MAG: hypothetical protein ETSY1_06870 [Candidatus Entotheonella factor]|uniref:Uncharacterized protein n=1 Tax=Entotheonella factor TaxID=1429438 RepID=W4LU96_ENTF1|nr:MAG: hypothetical protein ETSY1_06870 [Candidatus Entotheonella factor]